MKLRTIRNIEKAGGQVYLVGGAVRDQIIGAESKDNDFLVTNVPAEELKTILEEECKVDLVGKSFGVFICKNKYGGGEFEVALPRTEKSTGEGHRDFDVCYDHTLPVEVDLERRDFTVNSIAVNVTTKEIIDPYNGRRDIEKRLLIPTHENSFPDDPLRILRGCQFAARFKFIIPKGTLKQMRKHAHLLSSIAGERVFEEVSKALTRSEIPSIFFKYLKDANALEFIAPPLDECDEVTQDNKWHNLDVLQHMMVALDAVPSVKLHTRLAAIFHDCGKPACKFIGDDGQGHFYGHDKKSAEIAFNFLKDEWKVSHSICKDVVALISNHMFEMQFGVSITPKAVRRLIDKVGENLIYDLIDLRMGDRIASGKPCLTMGKVGQLKKLVEEELQEPAFSQKHLRIRGKDLIAEGYKPGKKFNEMLKYALEQVQEDKKLNTRKKLLDLIKRKYPVR